MSEMRDEFHTPSAIARRLVACFRSKSEDVIADFSAGRGELLRVAEQRWPQARLIATDIDARHMRYLRSRFPKWMAERCDFLSADARRRNRVLRSVAGKVSLILLNPPFSCRGGERYSARFGASDLRCSQAMAFLLAAVEYLSPHGRVAAILPAGCLSSEKDREAWAAVRASFEIRVAARFGMRAFESCAARTELVVLKRYTGQRSINFAPKRIRQRDIDVRLVRGTVSMHAAKNGLAGGPWPLVHTTELRDYRVASTDRRHIRELRRFVSGPAVLLPRVGEPDKRKCVLYLQNRRVILSDCIFGIRCKSRRDAEAVHARLTEQWHAVDEAYQGTCARHITRRRLMDLLERVRCNVVSDETQVHST